MKILIIEEDYVVREPVKIVLENNKHEVLTALDNKAGMQMISENSDINLVIINLDISKTLNGISVLEKMKEIGHMANRWLISQVMPENIVYLAKALGAQHALPKYNIWKKLKEEKLIK